MFGAAWKETPASGGGIYFGSEGHSLPQKQTVAGGLRHKILEKMESQESCCGWELILNMALDGQAPVPVESLMSGLKSFPLMTAITAHFYQMGHMHSPRTHQISTRALGGQGPEKVGLKMLEHLHCRWAGFLSSRHTRSVRRNELLVYCPDWEVLSGCVSNCPTLYCLDDSPSKGLGT